MKKIINMIISMSIIMVMFVPCVRADDTYIYLQTAADIKDLADKCAIDIYSEGKTAILKNDIDVSGVDFNGIPYYNGIIDGCGYTIRGINIDVLTPERGFIGTVGEKGLIKNLNIEADIKEKNEDSENNDSSEALRIIDDIKDGSISSLNKFKEDKGIYTVGGIAGINKGSIISCSFKGSIRASNTVGGIAGINEGRIETSSNFGRVQSSKNTGGIAGKNSGVIKWCHNYEKINDTPVEEMYATGGICGRSTGIIEACTNHAAIGYKNAGTAVGGISGIQSGNINECINEGIVYGKKRVGGICGNFVPYTNITYNPDEIQNKIDEQKENLKNDLEDINGKINEDRESIKSDFEEFRSGLQSGSGFGSLGNIQSSLDNVTGGINDVTSSLSELNSVISEKIKQNESLSEIAESAADATRSISDAVGVMSDAEKDLSYNNEALRELLEETAAAAGTFSDTAESLAVDVSDSTAHINELMDAISGSVNDEDRKKAINEALDAISKFDIPDIDVNMLDDTDYQLARAIKGLNSDISDILEPYLRISEKFNDLLDKLEEWKEKINETKKELEELLKELDGEIQEVSDPSHTYLPVIGEEKKKTSGLFITAYAEEKDKTTIEKLKDLDINDIDIPLKREICGYEREMALVEYCINRAEVSGLNDIGGISGGVGFETGINSELNIGTDGKELSLNPSTAIKAVISACINSGGITAKNSISGGITGYSDIGKIKDCINSGKIMVTDGNYSGGISGYDLNEIMRCINIGDLQSQGDAGGIAGYGTNLMQTYSLTRIYSDGERLGAVAGTASGNIIHNYFLHEDIGGINNVNYNDKAQPVEKEEIAKDGEISSEMSGLEERYWTASSGDLYMPQLKAFTENTAESISDTLKAESAAYALFRFTANFVIDGVSVKSVKMDYGEILDEDEIPEIPKKNGEYGVWDNDTDQKIIRNTVFTAQYSKSTASLSYGGEPPIILVEGDFSPDSFLEVNEFNPSSIINDDKYNALSGYELKIKDNDSEYDGNIIVHVRMPKDRENLKVGVITNDSVVITESTLDGSYIIFEPGNSKKFVILSEKENYAVYIIIGIIAAAAAVYIIVFRRRIKKRYLLMKRKLNKKKRKLKEKVNMYSIE